jgi:hypothetical protein
MGDRQDTRGDGSPRDRRAVRATRRRSRPTTIAGAMRSGAGFEGDLDRRGTRDSAFRERPERLRVRRERRSRTVAVVVLVVVALVIAIIGATAGASVLGEDAGDSPPFSLLPITAPSSSSATVGYSVAWKTTPSARTVAANGADESDSTAASKRVAVSNTAEDGVGASNGTAAPSRAEDGAGLGGVVSGDGIQNGGAGDVRLPVPSGAGSESGPVVVVDIRAEGSAETSR